MSARPASLRMSLALVQSREGDRVTTLELFFDLVYVFAFTQVSALMAHGDAPMSVLKGGIILSLLWWTWCSYAWLLNHARGDRGVVQVGVIAAMGAMFVIALGIPEAFHDLPGGLYAPGALVVCYAVMRLVHLFLYLAAAGDNVALRRQVLISLVGSALPTIVLLSIGVALGERWQVWVWLVAVVYDFGIIFVSSRGGVGWVVQSAAHFAERHALIVIIALGESIVAIGVGVAREPLGYRIVLASLLSIMVAVGMWWAYFRHVAIAVEHRMEQLTGAQRAHFGRDACTYLHFPIIAGIILAALGLEQAMAHLAEGRVGALGGWALTGGVTLYLLGTELLGVRADRRLRPQRLVVAGLLILLAIPLGSAHPILALAVVAGALAALALFEARSSTPVQSQA